MTGWDMLFWSVAALWCLTATALILRLRRLQSLPALQKVERDHREKVSIIVAARDEQLRIENTVRTLLAQQHVALELIVVDDRSTDATPAILRDAAAAEPRLTVLRIDALPEGWLGKSNALQTGSKVATGEWILFTDADCWMRQDVVARVLQAAERERADHVCLLPSLAPAGKRRSVLLQACHLVFYSSLGKQMATVNGDSPRGFCGVGAFNFVRADLYRKFGGHEPLRLEVADDPMLGVLVRRSAGRTRAYLAAQDVECDWSQSVFGFVKILEKNYFAMFRYRTVALHVMAGLVLLIWTCGLFAPFTGRASGMVCGIAFWSMGIPGMFIAQKMGWSVWPALLMSFAFIFLPIAMLNSCWKTLRQRGIRWRETFYPLQQLRAGQLDWNLSERFPTAHQG